MDNKKLKIFVSYHNEPIFFETEDIIPIHVWKSKSKMDFWILWDDTWDNISNKNNDYAELTAQYWVWKNYNLSDSDYVWFCHYRRYFTYKYRYNLLDSLKIMYRYSGSIMDFFARLFLYLKKSLRTDKIENIEKIGDNFVKLKKFVEFNEKNVFLSKPYFTFSLKHLWLKNNKIRNIFENSLLSQYPDYKSDLSYLNSLYKFNKFNRFNMFIMDFNTFKKYAKRQFSILFEFEKNIIRNQLYNDLLNEHIVESWFRPYWYISELMLNLWLIHNKDLKISRDLTITFYW